MDKSIESEVKHLFEVEQLSMRQIAKLIGIPRKRVSRIIKNERIVRPSTNTILKPYERLVREWYTLHPYLKATQVYERLKSYGFGGSYATVTIYTQQYRKKKKEAYHELEFLPGEEAQVDWMVEKLPHGVAYGFIFILAYSRYLWVRFYPRYTLEFFLDGHIEAYKEIGGVAHRNRYDNLKSVVISRKPELKFNAQFLDFSRHYRFSIHPCNPYRANEKGRVERVVRDIRNFLRVNNFTGIGDLNKHINLWRLEKNSRIHRSTGKTPKELLKEEKLLTLPVIHYLPYRRVGATISKTGFIEFETNRYSVPSSYSGMNCEILAYPTHIEILVKGKRVSVHKRSFERRQKIEKPSHREALIKNTPKFKYQRIYQLMNHMDKSISYFLEHVEKEGGAPVSVAYELFKLLKNVPKEMLLSAIREANTMSVFKVKYINSLLKMPEQREDNPVYPQNARLLEIQYERRDPSEYDELI